MLPRIVHTVLVYIVFGIGAGLRYIFFKIIGRKKKYNDLIEPSSQDKWNILITVIVVGLIIYLDSKYGVHLESKHPPIDQLIR